MEESVNLSGIAVSVRADQFEQTISKLGDLPGVEVRHRDAGSARIVVIQEAESVDAEVEGLKRIKSIPGVLVAELVYHYFAEDEGMATQASQAFDHEDGINESILRRLNPS